MNEPELLEVAGKFETLVNAPTFAQLEEGYRRFTERARKANEGHFTANYRENESEPPNVREGSAFTIAEELIVDAFAQGARGSRRS